MKRNLTLLILALATALLLGMLDHETESFVQLLLGDGGANAMALLLYTLFFAFLYHFIAKAMLYSSK